MKNITLFIFILFIFGCSVTEPLMKTNRSVRISQNDIRLKETLSKKDSVKILADIKRLQKKDTVKKNYTLFEYDVNGGLMLLEKMEEVLVLGRARNIAERNGSITMRFKIAVPRGIQNRNINTILIPTIKSDDTTYTIAPIQLTGDRYDFLLSRAKMFADNDSLRIRDTHSHAILDTVIIQSIKNNRYFVYNYVYQYPVKGDINQVDIILSGSLMGLDGSFLKITSPDTLPFKITSLNKFIDTRDRYVLKVISKYEKVNSIRNIVFNVNSSKIVDSIFNNKFELQRVDQVLDSITSLKEFTVDTLKIQASSSPDGQYQYNLKLSTLRGSAIKSYIENKSKIDSKKIIISNIAEDWNNLRRLVLEDTVIVDKKSYIDIIDSSLGEDAKERSLIKLADYQYLKERVYPRLRNVIFTYNLTRTGMVKDTLYTQEIDSTYRKAISVLQKRDYILAAKLFDKYNCRNLAIALMARNYNERAVKVLSMQPLDDAYSHYLSAICYSRIGNIEMAKKKFLESIKYDRFLRFRGNLDPEISQLNVKFDDTIKQPD